MTLEPGTFVRLIRDPARSGILQEGMKLFAGIPMAVVRFADGQQKRLPYADLEEVPSAPDSPMDRFAAGRFVEPDRLRRALTRLRVTGRLSEVVYSMEATETEFYAHQFKPVIKLMSSPTDALLIADEVGLGKTIEAGLIWTELRARLECNRLLVVCPKTLCQKWQDELAHRFGVDADIADAQMLLDALKRARTTGRGYALICSMQGVRPPRGWDRDQGPGEAKRRTPRYALARFLDDASDDEPLIDLLVVDEAHHMRNPKTMLHRLGKLGNDVASHRVFLSATPIHLRNRDLHSLLKMVDPYTFEYERTLNDLIESNAPIVAARDLLLRPDSSVAEILKHVEEAQEHDILKDSRALEQLRDDLSKSKLEPASRSALAMRLEQANQLANYLTRTRRRDVQEFRVIREPKAPVLEMNSDERYFYDEITMVVRDYAWGRDANELFLLSTPQRLLTSSLAAASAYWCGDADAYENEEVEESDDDLEHDVFDKRPLVRRIAERARALGMTELLSADDNKYQILVDELRGLWESSPDAKIIVFSSFKPTLRYLEKRFRHDGIQTELLHGGVKRPRADILANFREDSDVRILLSSEIGSEGIDLQFSSIVVNYDLPWNPMRLEQRIGRVDRLGQESEKVTILNLVYDDTIDRRIYDRLYERLEIGRHALGEMEAVLGHEIHDLTLRLMDPTLTDRQREDAIDQTAQALEYKRNEERRLEDDAGVLVHHGDYIVDRIMESRDRHRWLSDDDILIYVRDRVLRDFPGSVIETSPVGSDTYRIELSPDGVKEFQAFVAKRGLKGQTRLLSGRAQQRFRFSSSVVQKDRSVEYISQLHPIVRFAAERDSMDDDIHNALVVAGRVACDALPPDCVPGPYVLAARCWSSRNVSTGAITNVRIGYSGANVATGKMVEPDAVERVISVVGAEGRPMVNAANHVELTKALATLSEVVNPDLDRRFAEFMKRTNTDVEDRVSIRRRSLDRHFGEKLDMLHELQRNLEQQASWADANGDTRNAVRLKNLARARASDIEKSRQAWRLRENELDAQLESMPEESDVGLVFVQIEHVQSIQEAGT